MIGTTAATLPTSSSDCIIFLIRAGGNLLLYFFFLHGTFCIVANSAALDAKGVEAPNDDAKRQT